MEPRFVDYAARTVPRYTSYPTAPHFTGAVSGETYGRWLAALPRDARLSVYLHVPFCTALCHYCGCTTKAVRRPEPVAAYAATLAGEIDLVAAQIGGSRQVTHLHWGGGTPSLLDPADLDRILGRLAGVLDIAATAEHAIELDPRTVTAELAGNLARAGINRASLGVQDFNIHVQTAIGRIQPASVVAQAVEGLRAAGIGAINMDLMYGLPHQTTRDAERTADLAAALAPSRIALFGYAHVPWMKAHQRLIDSRALPGVAERLEQAEAAAERLLARGYRRIGIDHFAWPDDPLALAAAQRTLRRNFQGYTTETADALIGLGASSIGRLPAGYVQNLPDVAGWRRAIGGGQLPVARGRALSREDVARAEIIERLMCDMSVDARAVYARHGLPPALLADAEAALEPLARDGVVEQRGTRVSVPEPMRALARLAASCFDAYLDTGAGRHSVAV